MASFWTAFSFPHRLGGSSQRSSRMGSVTTVAAVGPYFARFLARFPDYRLDGAPVRSPRARFRGFISLPAVVG